MDLTKRIGSKAIYQFVEFMKEISDEIGFKVSSRGWGYIMEQKGIITKDQFDKVEDVINRARRSGLLPVDFVAEEAARAFEGVEEQTPRTLAEHVQLWLRTAMNCHNHYTPDWWEGEDYYIQMVVEKIDLVTLFREVCQVITFPLPTRKGGARFCNVLSIAAASKMPRNAE